MTTVCFLLPGLSACRGHQRLGGGDSHRPPGCQGPRREAQGGGRGVAPCSQYLSSPPARSFCSVELGPQVRPFFLPPTSSSFFGGALLRPHVPPPPLLLQLLLQPPPSTGVTGPEKPLGHWAQPVPVDLQPYSPHLGLTLHLEAQGSWDSDSNHDPSLLAILT